MSKQISLFPKNELETGTNKGYVFKFHVVRILARESAFHINTLFDGYNDSDFPNTSRETSGKMFIECNDESELDRIITQGPGRKSLYVLTKLKWQNVLSIIRSHNAYVSENESL